MSFSYATVISATDMSPRFRRIALTVEDPAALAVPPDADSAVGVYFPDGVQGRNYSVRHHIGDRIELDVFVHGRGPGTDWATTTRPGDRVGLDHARSWYRPPAIPHIDNWQLLVCDMAGLPAAARIIEELRTGTPVIAAVEVVEQTDLDYLPGHPGLSVVPSIGTGNGDASSRLVDLVRQITASAGFENGYCWFGGEAAAARAVRKHLRGRGWTSEHTDIVGYWRFDSQAWDARYAEAGDELFAVYHRARALGKSDKQAAEEYDEALERAGL